MKIFKKFKLIIFFLIIISIFYLIFYLYLNYLQYFLTDNIQLIGPDNLDFIE